MIMTMKNPTFEVTGNRGKRLAAMLGITVSLLLGKPMWAQAQQNDDPDPAPQEVARTVEREVQRLVAQATRDAERNLADVAGKVAEARDEVLFRQRPGGPTADRLQGIVRRGPGSGGKALVIRTSEIDPKEQTNLEEDMAVMSHLLEKTVADELGRQSQPRKAMGIDLFFTPNSTPFRSMFIQGYGALFLVNVGFPLLPPASKEPPSSEKPASDSDWEQARRELYGGRMERKWVSGPVEPYDEEKVKKLKDQLLEALKNAANIRTLKGDDVITVCVFGGSTGGPMKVKSMTMTKGQAPKPGRPGPVEEREEVIVRSEDGPPGAGRGTVMTLQVKKADAEAFAKGKLDLDEFREKARITTYAGGDAASEANPWFGFSGGGFGASFDTR